MINFKEIAEGVLSGELKGIFVLRNGCTRNSNELARNKNGLTELFPYYLVDDGTLTENGTAYEKVECEYDVVDFIVEDVTTLTDEEIKKRAELYARYSSRANNTAYYAYIEGVTGYDKDYDLLEKID